MKITSDNTLGRVLIALRAGRMEPDQLNERFSGSSTTVSVLHANGLIESVNGFWQLTSAGRDVCPNRRDAKPVMPHANKSRPHGWSSTRKNPINVKPKTSEEKPIAAVPAAPAEPNQEKTMNEKVKRRGGGTPSPLNLAIYNNVVVSPGIKIPKLIRNVLDEMPEENAPHIRKTIQNMVHCTKQLRSEGSGNDRSLHLNVIGAAASDAAAAQYLNSKALSGKVITGSDADALRGDPVPVAFTSPDKPENSAIPADAEFSLMLSDENVLHIRIGANETRLNPMQLARLDHFLARVLPDGVRNLDGVPA